MDKEILQAIRELLREELEPIVSKLDSIEHKLNSVHDQTATLTEFRTEVNVKLEELKDLKDVTKENCYDIAKLKAIK
jgi:prefoldin subunit 5